MRRPHIYERSVPRTRRQAYQEPAGDPDIYGWAIVRTLPAMIQDAEDAGLTIVASHPTRALKAAEGRSAEPLESAVDEP